MEKYRNLDMLTLGLCIILGASLCPGVNCDNHDDSGDSDMERSWEVCKMDSERGDCFNYTVKWFFNESSSSCERFWYGGCNGNGNNFGDEEECLSHCKPDLKGTDNIVITEDDSKVNKKSPITGPISSDTCRHPKSQGTCRDFTIKWFYNTDKEACDRFWYGGCDGNGNRFDNETDCKMACPATDDVCKQPSVTGRCRARHLRWYYNTDSQECLEFIYGGCGGNGNRFRTKAECQRQCLSGSAALGDENRGCNFSRFGCCPDQITEARGNNNEGCPNTCKATLYGCCDDEITAAQGPNEEGCEVIEISSGDGAVCDQSEFGCCPDGVTSATGPRDAGCDDITVVETTTESPDTDITVDVPEPRVPVCEQPKEIGPCRSILRRWFFNSNTRVCEEFDYGGCRGNNNNFKTQDNCERYCGVRRGTPVSKPGTCPRLASVENCRSTCRYDGDCPGNDKCCSDANRCSRCSAPQREREIVLTPKEVCAQPQEVGPCRAGMVRFFYNPETKQCEEFTYGGCGGNRNNFELAETCQRYCKSEVVISPSRPTREPVCEMTPALGPCHRTVAKYFYNITKMQCEPFTYGGCLGNHNNFETETKCMSYCGLRQGNSERDNCELQKEPGKCRGSYRRYYYDVRQGECFEFAYGGCQGNGNNFGTYQSCMSSCRGIMVDEPDTVTRPPPRTLPPPRREEDVCSLPLASPCNNGRVNRQMWYYDKLEGMCKAAPGGCNNNRNNFASKEACESYCSKQRVCRPLTYSSDIRCLALIPRWTFNPESDRCESFSYGGCGGTANNFQSEDACQQKCGPTISVVTAAPQPATADEICGMPEDSGNCLTFNQKWRYDSLTGSCKEFKYGGCGGNRNNFDTRESCERYCSREVVCRPFEEPEIGCLAYFPRWRYVSSSGQCENFVYGGCGGNANNFESFEACEGKCLARIVPDREEEKNRVDNRVSSWRDICRLQADVGPCKQYIRKWHYNSVSQSCEEFTYGGCLGNHNNFESRVQCMTYCDASKTDLETTTEEPDIDIDVDGSGEIPTVEPVSGVDVCHLDSKTGRCSAYNRNYFYNHTAGECALFIYGGCDGNENRFEKREDCERQCGPREVCLLPQQSGSCLAYKPRYFFDYSAQDCIQFIYGGCEPNANNFLTKEACLGRCGSLIRQEPPAPTGGPKVGYCPARTDWQGLLGACAPQCREDTDCIGNQKCCHHGCGFRCIDPVDDEPYQMDAPNRILAEAVSDNTIDLSWRDPSLGIDQLIRDNRYYTIRYYSYSLGQYNYVNVTDLRGHLNGLQSDTDYEINIRSNNPPYLSKWSEAVRNRTAPRVVLKVGQCPAVNDVGICMDSCQVDFDCTGSQKCCSNGCGHVCMDPEGFDVCSLAKDPGSCSNWEVRWFFNTTIDRCDRFWYGGCSEGNQNNFMNEAECKTKCGEAPVVTRAPVTSRPYDCRRSLYGCCDDQYTQAVDSQGSNCIENIRRPTGETLVPATPGESVTLSCRYGNNVTWYRDGKLVETDDHRRVNDDGTLVVYATNIEDDGMYACHVLGSSGRTNIYRYMLQVRVPIGIFPGPEKIMVKPNHMAFLHCEVYGNPKPTVMWRKGSSPVQSGGRFSTFSNGTLLIRQVAEEDMDGYTCKADNGVSQATERTIDLVLREMLVARIENDNGRVTEGSRMTLTCEGRGYPTPTISWEKMGRPLTIGGSVYISSNGKLTIRDVTLDDTGTYSCIVSNSEEKIETSTSVQVVPRVVVDDRCEDKTSIMKCRLIVTARLCGYTMYSKICCNSCRNYFNGDA